MPGRIATRAADAAAPLSSAASQGNAQQILDGWRASAVDAAVTGLARASLRPEYQKAIQAQSERFGRELSDEEMDLISESVDDRMLDGARQTVKTQLASDPAARARLVADAADDLKARAPELRNPFAPLAAGDPGARAKEKVLWENGTLMVLVDRFSKAPHLLVVPKAPMLLPTDAPPATLDELGRVGKIASDVLSKVAHVGASERFVNPPQMISIAQLHLHVIPPMKSLTDRGAAKLWAKVGPALTKALGS